MKRKSLFVGVMILFGLTGCAEKPEERPLPTLAPEVREEKAGDETSEESKEPEKSVSIGDILGGGMDIVRYVERARTAKDENLAATLETAIEVACLEYVGRGEKLPEEPIHFRYTHELEELDDTYSVIKETIREIVGDDEITLSDEDFYMMVTISKKENGMPEVKVEIMQE